MMYIAKTELHPKEQTLRDFAEGKLDREETVAVTAHLASCLNCINKLAEIASEMPCEVPVGFEEEVNYRIAREKERKAEFPPLLFPGFHCCLCCDFPAFSRNAASNGGKALHRKDIPSRFFRCEHHQLTPQRFLAKNSQFGGFSEC
jgi:hypothetical protein